MDNVRRGELIAAIGGAALLIIMFLFDWFGAPGSEFADEATDAAAQLGIAVPEVDLSFNAWDSMEIIRFLLLLTGLVALGLGIGAAMSSTVELPVAGSALTAGLGILSVVFIAYRILDPPGGTDREIGVFLGLAAAIGVAYGGWLAMQDEGVTFGSQADSLQDRVGGGGGDAAPPPPSTSSSAPPPSSPPPQ